MVESNKGIVTNTRETVNGNIRIPYIRSFPAMILSAVFPGLGQMYLGQYFKAVFILIGFFSALGFFYLNSYPVNEWKDLLQFSTLSYSSKILHTKTEEKPNHEGSIKLWTLDDGKILMYRPSWKLKITSTIQGLIFWIYAVSTGWKGKPKII